MERQSKQQRELIVKHLNSLKRFNEWEKNQLDTNRLDTMDERYRLSAVFELYEMMPEKAREREINVEGIIKMRKALACLK